MIYSFVTLLILALIRATYEQSTPVSPCPNVFDYEPPGTEPGRWYGVVHLSTDSTLHSLWLNIVLDSKADIVGNWVGDVTTKDNIDFKIENTNMKISPGPAVAVRFFVQYNTLNKIPKLVEIRLNGREICSANSPQPAVEQSDGSSRPNRPETSARPQTQQRPQKQQPTVSRPQTSDIRPEDRTETRPVQGRPTNEGPVYVRPSNNVPSPSSIEGGSSSQSFDTNTRPNGGGRPSISSTSNTPPPRRPSSSSYNSGSVNTEVEVPSQSYDLNSRPSSGGGVTTSRPRHTTSTEIPDYGDSNDKDDDYFEGYRPTIVISESKAQCGRVLLNSPVPLVVNGTPTLEGQWPWQIALYQTQTVDNKYICGGTLVSHRHIITAAHCVTRKNSKRIVNKNTLTVYLGKHNLRTSVDGVQIEFVDHITVHPQYNASTFSKDVSILQLRKPVTYTNWVQPACLWPEDSVSLSSVIGKKGSVVGWGFDETGVATEELSLVEMPVVDTETCIRSYSEFFVRFTSEYTFCAGYRDGVLDKQNGVRDKRADSARDDGLYTSQENTRSSHLMHKKRTSVCNGDSGGGMVFRIDGSWYLRGLVSLSVARQNEFRCDPTHYVIFTDLAKMLPWIKKNISDF